VTYIQHLIGNLGLVDPAVLTVLAAVSLLSVLGWKYAGRSAGKSVAPRQNKNLINAKATRTESKSQSSVTNLTAPPATGQAPPATQLDRLAAIIQAGTAQGQRVATAHANAAVKIDAAELALGQMLRDMRTLAAGQPRAPGLRAATALPTITDLVAAEEQLAA
jgi:hypothetical protein